MCRTFGDCQVGECMASRSCVFGMHSNYALPVRGCTPHQVHRCSAGRLGYKRAHNSKASGPPVRESGAIARWSAALAAPRREGLPNSPGSMALSMVLSSAALARPMLLRTAPPVVLARRALAAKMKIDNDQGVEYEVQKSAENWREELTPEQYYILREKGTERPGTGEYDKFYPKDGHFVCAGCGTPLYSAAAKFNSGCGWPAFDKIVKDSVVTQTDNSFGMKRVEIMCAGCGGHLGHVFEGERFTPTNERHCVNSISVKYVDAPLPDGKSETKVLPEPETSAKESILSALLGKDGDQQS